MKLEVDSLKHGGKKADDHGRDTDLLASYTGRDWLAGRSRRWGDGTVAGLGRGVRNGDDGGRDLANGAAGLRSRARGNGVRDSRLLRRRGRARRGQVNDRRGDLAGGADGHGRRARGDGVSKGGPGRGDGRLSGRFAVLVVVLVLAGVGGDVQVAEVVAAVGAVVAAKAVGWVALARGIALALVLLSDCANVIPASAGTSGFHVSKLTDRPLYVALLRSQDHGHLLEEHSGILVAGAGGLALLRRIAVGVGHDGSEGLRVDIRTAIVLEAVDRVVGNDSRGQQEAGRDEVRHLVGLQTSD
jgi:hypothetical protein